MIRTVPIKFRTAGKHYLFNAQTFDLNKGDSVVVETDRGRTLGFVVSPPVETPRSEAPEDIKSILKLATEEDISLAKNNAAKEDEAFHFCLNRILERNMEMKLVRAEYLFDGSKIIFYFTADGRVDFRELVKDLAHNFHTRIEMRQIGVRDEAKLTGGLGVCGRELCCSTFLVDFSPVSVKMAKEQGLALNPNKISGQCGRLLCCLAYEYETYCDLRKALPKCGRKITLQDGEAEVVEQNVLAQTITARTASGQRTVLSREEIENPATAAKSIEKEPTEQPRQPRKQVSPPKDRPSRKPGTPPETPQTGEVSAEGKKKSRRRRRPRRNRSGSGEQNG